ncbi:MAG: hypothetical protein DMD90_01740 [Candidatus Rokuibacteriota bacterium]|nr:MAG: hypothetical protein DMD90_01740 [Candidatus Rokubacteria bacterium]
MHLLASQTCSRDLDQLGDEIAELSAHLDAATARLLDLIREFDARVVHVDAPVLADPDQPGQSLLENGARVSAETSRRIACDASRVIMQHRCDGRVVEVGTRTRTIPPAIRRALHHRDRACRFPGCGVRFGQGHHIRHWANGGPTTLSNLALLCRRHHRAVHEEGYQSCPRSRRLPRYLAIPCTRCVRATRQTVGERLDVGYAISVLHPLAR